MSDVERLEAKLEEVLQELRSIRRQAERPTVMSYETAARELDISVPTLKRMISKGQLLAIPRGDGRGVPAHEIDRIAAGAKTDPVKRLPRAKPPRGSSERERAREALREAKRRERES